MDKIVAYCDGACRNNQSKENVGASGAILTWKGKSKSYTKIFENTTNNICEIESALLALEKIKVFDTPIEIVMDSQYVVTGMNAWIFQWIANDWNGSTGKPILNQHEWKQLYFMCTAVFPNLVTFTKCKGHASDRGNIAVDKLCNEAIDEYLRRKTK